MGMQKRQPIFHFDLIRVLSTILIVCCHFSVCYTQYNIGGFNNFLLYFANTDSGKIGVCLFFMLSGASLIYNYDNEDFSWKNFYKKRYLKIFPSFYLAWLLFYIFKVWETKNVLYNGSALRIVWTLVGLDYYLGGATPTYAIVGEWFTGAIVIIYAVFPILRIWYKSKYGYYVTSFVLYTLWIVNWFIKPLPHAPNVESIFVDIFYFWLGMVFVKEKDIIDRISIKVLVIILIPMLLVRNNFNVMTNSLIISISLYFLCVRGDKLKLQLESNIAFKFICKYSYLIYLIHHQVFYIFMKKFADSFMPIWKSLIVLGVICLIISLLAVVISRITMLGTKILKLLISKN